MKASIVIDNYNYGRFLREAIDSALGQDYHDCEVIVVDDGSTDDSPQIITSYDGRIVPVLKTNGGQPSAFNAGFHASTGEALCFLDADDWLLPGAIAKAMHLFAEPNTVKVHWPLFVVDSAGQPTGKTFPSAPMPDGDFSEVAISAGPFYDSRFLPPTSGSLWRRSFLEKVMPIPDEGFSPTGAEVFLHSLVPIFGLMRAVHEPQGFYRVHGANHFWSTELPDQKIEQYLRRTEACMSALSRHLRRRGIVADLERWKSRNFNYLWLERLRQAKDDIQRLLPANEICLLVNDYEWGEGNAVAGRRITYFHEQNGSYWLPPNDEAAIEHLRRREAPEVRFLAFWWTSFWWFQKYPEFTRYLRSNFKRVLESDGLIIFDLQTQLCGR